MLIHNMLWILTSVAYTRFIVIIFIIIIIIMFFIIIIMFIIIMIMYKLRRKSNVMNFFSWCCGLGWILLSFFLQIISFFFGW